MSNVACRLFKEQIELINNLPEQERPHVLYAAVMNAFNQFDNQFENQFDNQFDNQFENAYISVSVSDIGKSIINLLSKNIVVKEFSTNYGGRRPNAGKKPQKTAENFLDTSIDTSNGTTKSKVSKVSKLSKVDIATPTTPISNNNNINNNNINNNNINNINNNNINNNNNNINNNINNINNNNNINNINNTGIDNKGGVGGKEGREYTPEEKEANKEKAQQIIQQIAQVATRQPDQVSITYNNVIVHGLLGKFLKDNFGEDTVTRARDWMIDHVAGQNWNADKIIKLMCRWTGKTPFLEINKWADFCEKHKKQNKNQNNS